MKAMRSKWQIGEIMKKKTILYILSVLFVAMVLTVMGLHLSPCPDTVMTTENNGFVPWGTVEIPSAGVHTLLYPVHVDGCGELVLWNGGRIHADEEAFADIKLWDTATIRPEKMVLECVSIDRCVNIGGWLVGWQGVIHPGGDVLIINGTTVYRFTLL